jgi:hypothetical protein
MKTLFVVVNREGKAPNYKGQTILIIHVHHKSLEEMEKKTLWNLLTSSLVIGGFKF